MIRFNRTLAFSIGLGLILGVGSPFDARSEEPAVSEAPAKKSKAKRVIRKKRAVRRPAPGKKGVPIPAQAAPAPKRDSLQAWLKDLKKRLEKSRARHNQIVAVAAVRGNETPDAPPLYWKGKKSSGPAAMPELTEFETAVEAALNGDPAAAREKLNAFLTGNPNSSLVGDARETLSRLPAETAP